ncbi:GAF domain-containing protein [Brachybacterium saurashtrense]|uniref:GAF domain-containing protein n=1 Tax=Brachybacterium saurashtrense TaxID=556288 RepID=A0A345YK33_9MICO|nr:GAF domain-containing protein [Brachybacterium saurashtrense]AXK44285.1 GAF domain-containing protein [Brachybacterium saurashtrense]RRR21321.1 GAF domain-containing protein [Brachybacterium saurashtrense]RRR22896.1 GAF domain-containing protein [Brachybacterium saurashtrense]
MTATGWSPTDSDYQARLLRAHEDLREHAEIRAVGPPVREAVLASWRRSLTTLPSPAGSGRAVLEGEELARAREYHLFSAVLPLLRSRLIEPAVEAGLMVALGDARGRLLWVEGRPRLLSRADAMGFAAGADWSEGAMGTSAPALALTTSAPMQVVGAEHFHEAVHPWSCSAVPVRHPHSREILGVLDVTGSTEAVSPLVLPLLEATARAVQEELAAQLPVGPAQRAPSRGPRPRILPRSPAAPAARAALLLTGRRTPLLQVGAHYHPLSGRHAELLTLLHLAPEGRSAAELAEALHGDAAAEGTVRAELVRLRRVLAQAGEHGLEILPRPYRLRGELDSDLRRARAALERGDVDAALAECAGALLPASDAPALRRLRGGLDAHLRELLLERGSAAQLWRYAQREEAQGDLEVLMAILEVAAPAAPERAAAAARARALRGEAG